MTAAPSAGSTLVGRDEELAVLHEALAESAEGRGRFVVVSGEAGIGKSRLLEEIVTPASASHVVLTGRAVEGGGPYRPVADALVGALRAGVEVTPESLGPYGPALARLLPDWSSAAGPPSTEPGLDPALVLGEAVARFLGVVGRGRPCLLLLEDLHWADADSWAVLAHVAVVVPSLPVVVLVTVREDEPGTSPATSLARLPGVTTLPLERLSSAEVHRLAVALGAPDPATWTMLDDRADGLPFLVEELVALRGSGALPPTLQALVADRLAQLSPEHRRVLTGAAVLGLAPDWTLLHRVTDIAEPDVLAALRTAEELRLLAVDAGTLRWRHALTHEAVLALVLPPERAVLARRAAEVLLARGRPDDDTAAAELLLTAGVDHVAADLLLTLVRRYLAVGAFHSAERLLDELAGVRSHRAAGDGRAGPVALPPGPGARGPGRRRAGSRRGDRGEHVELALTLARAAVLTGRWDTVRDLVERAGRPDDAALRDPPRRRRAR